jgi:hypothetical protein
LLLGFALLAAVLPAQNATLRTTAPKSAANPHQQFQRLLAAPLPGKAAAEAAPAFYRPDTLYQQIDGGADVYLLYDFRELLHQDFKSGAIEVTADIYDMGKPEDAFGIYAAERSPKYKFAILGTEGYRSKGVLNFVQDRYYVKLTGSGPNPDPLLGLFAQMLSQRIGGQRVQPTLLRKLPAEHRIAHSEQYIRKDPLGHAFLAPAYAAVYAWQEEGKVLISVAKDGASAKSRLDQLAKHFKQSGECAAAPDAGTDAIQAKNSFEGRVLARTQGPYVLLLLNPPADGSQILKTMAQNLR